mgnify:CR=1 FL=1
MNQPHSHVNRGTNHCRNYLPSSDVYFEQSVYFEPEPYEGRLFSVVAKRVS